MSYFNKFFNSGHKIAAHGSPFNIYWVCRLFDEVRADITYKQRDMLKNLTNKYLYWGRLSQINEIAPHHDCHCFHCKIHDDCFQILLERQQLEKEP